VRVYACYLRRGVYAQAQTSTAELIHHFESLQILRAAGGRQQRIDMLEQGRHDKLIAKAPGRVQAQTT